MDSTLSNEVLYTSCSVFRVIILLKCPISITWWHFMFKDPHVLVLLQDSFHRVQSSYPMSSETSPDHYLVVMLHSSNSALRRISLIMPSPDLLFVIATITKRRSGDGIMSDILLKGDQRIYIHSSMVTGSISRHHSTLRNLFLSLMKGFLAAPPLFGDR
jgi:hypothetical protein